mgnify:FL=1
MFGYEAQEDMKPAERTFRTLHGAALALEGPARPGEVGADYAARLQAKMERITEIQFPQLVIRLAASGQIERVA